MKFREKLMQERPENCGRGEGGCIGCPKNYGYETERPCESNFCWESANCTECWDREIPDTCNQTAKADAGKPRLTLVPRRIIWDIAAIREYGNRKYGDPENWRTVEPGRYRDAMMRHMMAYLDDPKSRDEESGLPHLWHMACNIAFLCEMEDGDAEAPGR